MAKITKSKRVERHKRNNEEVQMAQSKPHRSAGEKFWVDLMRTPYTTDRVGQAFVITHYRTPEEKKPDNYPEHEE